jgi:hypothetical protein
MVPRFPIGLSAEAQCDRWLAKLGTPSGNLWVAVCDIEAPGGLVMPGSADLAGAEARILAGRYGYTVLELRRVSMVVEEVRQVVAIAA